jgi:hypothetical protein
MEAIVGVGSVVEVELPGLTTPEQPARLNVDKTAARENVS